MLLSNGKVKYKVDNYITNEIIESFCSSGSEDDNGDYDGCTIVASSFDYNLIDIDSTDIPSPEINILKTMSSGKSLVQFVKKVRIKSLIHKQYTYKGHNKKYSDQN